MSDTRYQILLDGKVRPTMESWPTREEAENGIERLMRNENIMRCRLTVEMRGPIIVDAGPSDGSLVGKVEGDGDRRT